MRVYIYFVSKSKCEAVCRIHSSENVIFWLLFKHPKYNLLRPSVCWSCYKVNLLNIYHCPIRIYRDKTMPDNSMYIPNAYEQN